MKSPKFISAVGATFILLLSFLFLTSQPEDPEQKNADSSATNSDSAIGERSSDSNLKEKISPASAPAQEENSTDKSAGQNSTVTLQDAPAQANASQFATILPLGKSEAPLSEFGKLFTAKVGEKVTVAFTPPLTGVVTLNHLHDTGGRALAISIDGLEDAVAFFVRQPDGTINGHMLEEGNSVGFLVTTDPDQGIVEARRTHVNGIVCARVDGDNFVTGMLAPDGETEASADATPQASIPVLESKPGAARVIYLDFDGEVVENTSWRNGARINARPYANQSNIAGIWASMSEDFSPFNVNVTTSRSVFNNAAANRRCMVIFTPDDDAAPGAGGVAYLNSFGGSVNYMCWVFNGGLNSAAEAGTHEAGHQLGLSHDGTSSKQYYSGHIHSPSRVSWGPVMGGSYGLDIVQFSKGEYTSANNQENDLSKVSSYLPFRSDDHGDNTSNATSVTAGTDSTFTRSGIIETNGDVDMFRIMTSEQGMISVDVEPVARYANLDIQLQVLSSNGTVLSTNSPEGPFSASISAPGMAAGTYYLRVAGVGLGSTGFAENGYNGYGSLGQYTISGSYEFDSNNLAPPTNLSASDGASMEHVILSWNTQDNATGYRLYRSSANNTSSATLLAETAATFHNDVTAEPGTTYFYFVSAYNATTESDLSASESGFRASAGVTPSPVNSTFSFETQPGPSQGWEYSSSPTGRIQAAGGELQMDDSVGDDVYALNEAILHVDLSGESNVVLTFTHRSSSDELTQMPSTFSGSHNSDGVAISADGINWFRVATLADASSSSRSVTVNLDIAAASEGISYNSDFLIKFQQYDNYPSADDGRAFDNVSVTSALTPVVPDHIETFDTLPTGAEGWQFSSTNTGRIRVSGGALMLDDSVGDDSYSLNEAILHVDLSESLNVELRFDFSDSGDENNAMPQTYTGSVNADGVAISDDGTNWFRLSSLSDSQSTRAQRVVDLDELAAAAGMSLVADFRIKFQQYDNYPGDSDGRFFDNIQVLRSDDPPTGDDFGDSLDSAFNLSVGGSPVNGELERAGDRDWFRFTVSESGTFRIYTAGPADTYGRLYGSDGTTLLNDPHEDDDRATDSDWSTGLLNFGIETSLAAGTYYVSVGGYDDDAIGTYELSLEQTSTDFTPDLTAPKLTFRGSSSIRRANPAVTVVATDDRGLKRVAFYAPRTRETVYPSGRKRQRARFDYLGPDRKRIRVRVVVQDQAGNRIVKRKSFRLRP